MSHTFSFAPLSPKTPTKEPCAIFGALPGSNSHNTNIQRTLKQNEDFNSLSTSSIPSISPLSSPTNFPKRRTERPLSYLKSPEKAREHRRIANQQRLKDRIRHKNMETLENGYFQATQLNYILELERESKKHIVSPEDAEKAALEIQQDNIQNNETKPPSINEADLFEASLNEEIEVPEWIDFDEMEIDDDECF